jgi:hypothetical protein
LPIENRSPLLPLPPKTIFEAFPHTKKWWPSWDPRKQFNCLLTSMAKPKLTEQIHHALAKCKDPPPQRVRKYVLETCRTTNLVWVGLNKIAHLEPDEMEFLLGFPKDHTRGIGRTERFKSLGNSFHVDTVAYHLSALQDMFPHGMNVLSLFSGIGGAEVALQSPQARHLHEDSRFSGDIRGEQVHLEDLVESDPNRHFDRDHRCLEPDYREA